MVSQIGNITSIVASVGSVVVILFALAKWGARVENKLDELSKKSHTHRRFGLGALIAALIMLFKE